MKEFTAEEVYTIVKEMREFNPDEFAIIEFLKNSEEKWVEITYSRLSRKLCRHISNIRKAVISLKKKEIVSVEYTQMANSMPMTAIHLNKDWLSAVLRGAQYE